MTIDTYVSEIALQNKITIHKNDTTGSDRKTVSKAIGNSKIVNAKRNNSLL